MNWLDILIIIIIALPAYIGFSRGLIGMLVPLVGIVLGIIIAGRAYGNLSEWFYTDPFTSQSQADIIAFITIVILFVMVTLIISSIISRFLRLFLLGWTDKIGGLLLGLATGIAIASIALALAIKFFPNSLEETISGSTLASFLLDRVPLVYHLLPNEFDAVRHFFN
jgi:membrane protein required for colicin V production